jgi:hypothetical protein
MAAIGCDEQVEAAALTQNGELTRELFAGVDTVT